MSKKTIQDISVKGKKVFVRADYNVPQDKAGQITDDTRIRATLPTLKALLVKGGAVIIASHLDAVNHARIGREEMRCFVEEKSLTKTVHIPEDGEELFF